MRHLILVATLILPSAAMAQTSTPYDVPYFANHPDKLRGVLQTCRLDASYAHTPTCKNAERASHISGAGKVALTHAPGAREAQRMLDPAQYWADNPVAREGVLAQCRRRGPGDQMMLRYCSVAAQGALQDIARR